MKKLIFGIIFPIITFVFIVTPVSAENADKYIAVQDKGSEIWLMDRTSGVYIGENGQECSWSDFKKIAVVPAGSLLRDGIWYTADNIKIGPSYQDSQHQGNFAVIQEIYSNPCDGVHGLLYKSPLAPGLIIN